MDVKADRVFERRTYYPNDVQADSSRITPVAIRIECRQVSRMAFETVFLVEHDPMVAWKISQAIEARGIPRPRHITNGREAIEQINHEDCGLCLIAYELPDMNGVEAVVRLRQRKPALPIVMLSGAGSESVAVAAFRAGISDYLAKDAQLYDSVVRVVEHINDAKSTQSALRTAPSIPPELPSELMNHTYQNRLRVIGRQLDLNRYRMASVFEVQGGFLVRALPEIGRDAEAIEFPDRDFLHWVTDAYVNRGEGERGNSQSPLLPSGYEDFLRAMGAALDRHKAEAVSIAEYSTVIVIGGTSNVDSLAQPKVGNLQWILGHDDILQILDEGYRRRNQTANPYGKTGSVLDRIFGRQAKLQSARV